jgi:hypothetical protein
MHRIARLEPDDPAPAQADELCAQIRRCEPKGPEIVMRGQLQTFHASTQVPAMSLVHKIIDTGMYCAGASQNSLRFRLAIGLPDILHKQYPEHHALGIPQRNFGAPRFERFRKRLRHIERNRDRPNQAVGQSHLMADALVIIAIHEAAQR